jgi:hypothetical protein
LLIFSDRDRSTLRTSPSLVAAPLRARLIRELGIALV